MKAIVLLLIPVLLLVLVSLKLSGALPDHDIQCSSNHKTTSTPPKSVHSAKDYFELGNYHYDIGKCKEAVIDYTKAIKLDPKNAQIYNNRAYTNMRLRNYAASLSDLDKAIALRPNYTTALMNRGDIYNYYYQIDRQRAINDYNKVISLGKEKDLTRSVCGHKLMAENNKFIPLVFLKLFMNRGSCN